MLLELTRTRLKALAILACILLLAACGEACAPGAPPDEKGAPEAHPETPSQEDIAAAFEAEWEAFIEPQALEVTNDLLLRISGLSEEGAEKLHEEVKADMEARFDMDSLKAAFASRYEGYLSLRDRLEEERHPNPDAERQRWFSALAWDHTVEGQERR
jgi:predicted small lipoprotein YifL